MSDKVEERKDDLARLENIMNRDVVALTHIQMKLSQIEAKNTRMFMEAQSGVHKIKEVRTGSHQCPILETGSCQV